MTEVKKENWIYFRGMPSKKRSKKRSPGRLQIYGKAANQLYKDVRMLKDVLNVEYKNYISELTGNVFTTSSCASLMTPISEGSDFFNRNGNQVKAQRISGRGYLIRTASYDTVSACARLIIFIDKCNEFGADTDTYRKIIGDGSGTPFTSGFEPLYPKDPHHIKKTKFLYDKTFVFEGDAASDAARYKYFKFNIPINKVVRWEESGEAVSMNDIKIMWISDVVAGSATAVQARMVYNLSFTDN